MRAPDETINVSDARWQQVKDVCRRVNVDADTVIVNGKPLRAELARLTAMYNRHKISKAPTERQCNEVIEEGLDKISDFRKQYTLQRDADGHEYHEMVGYFVSHGVIKKVLQSLDELEKELRASLVAKPMRESNAAVRERDHQWFLFVRLWKKIAPHNRKRKPLSNFLQAATGASASAVKNFLDRLPSKMRTDNEFWYMTLGA